MWDLYPYSNFHELNQDWILSILKKFENELKQAIDYKTIHYADPLQWNITTQYAPNTVVVDENTGIAYISKDAVPSGVLLSNENYWMVVFDYQKIYNKIMSGVAFNDKDNETASKDLLVNDLVWYHGDLYRVTRAISKGSKYIIGTNLIATTIESLLSNYYGRDRVSQLINDTLNVSGDYTINAGDIAETSSNRTEKVTSDREIDVDGSDSIHVDGVTTINRGGAVTEVYGNSKNMRIMSTSENVYDGQHSSTFKSKTTVNGTDSIVNFSNDIEIDAQNINLNANKQITCTGITNITRLKYSAPTDINKYFKKVTALDDNNNEYSLLVANNDNLNNLIPYNYLKDKKIMIFGDSISDEINNPSFNIHPNWVQTMREMLNGIATVDNNSLAGRRMIELPNVISTYETLDYDFVIIFLGTNDYSSNIPLGYNYQTEEHVNDWFSPAVCASWERIRTRLVKANKPEAQIVFITPLYREPILNALFSIDCYTASITAFANRFDTTFINGTACNPISEHSTQYLMPDKLHLNPLGGKILANYVINKLCSGCDSVPDFSPNKIKHLPAADSEHSTNLNIYYNIGLKGLNLNVNGTFTPAQNTNYLPIINFSTIANIITVTNDVIYGIPYVFNTTTGFIPCHTYIDNNQMILKADNNETFTANTQYSLVLHDSWLPGFMNFPQNN